MLNVCDLSSNNPTSQRIAAIKENDAVIVKATEGKTYVNPYWKSDIRRAIGEGKVIGLYHYARPESNSAKEEAIHFCYTVREYIGQAVLVLDWEGKALECAQTWAREWLDTVYQLTGVRPLVYVSEAYRKRVGVAVQSGNYGLWVAKYSKKEPQADPWAFKAMWQYTSSPYDKSCFYGDRAAWQKYAARG